MKSKLLLSFSTYLLMSLAGGGSFVLPDQIDVPQSTVTPAVEGPLASSVYAAAADDDRASLRNATSSTGAGRPDAIPPSGSPVS